MVDFFALEVECFSDELLAFALRDFDELFDFAERDLDALVDVKRTRLRLLLAQRARIDFVQRTGSGGQPTSASARNADGIAITGVGPSTTASTAASDRSERTSAIIRAGRCALAA